MNKEQAMKEAIEMSIRRLTTLERTIATAKAGELIDAKQELYSIVFALKCSLLEK